MNRLTCPFAILPMLLFFSIPPVPCLSQSVESAKTDEPEPKPPYFNFEARQMLIEGSYDVLPSTPVIVAHTRQLLMDDHVVDDAWGCRRTVHQPEKHSDNPLLSSEDPTGRIYPDRSPARRRREGRRLV